MTRLSSRQLCLAALWCLSVAAGWATLAATLALSLNDYRYSQIILIPVISVCTVYLKRQLKRPPIEAVYWPAGGIPLLVAGAGLYSLGRFQFGPRYDGMNLAIAVLGLVIFWAGSFAVCYGRQALRRALFPFGFLLFLVPVPPVWLEQIIVLLQHGSAEISALLFQLSGEAFFRQGLEFSLPGVTIEVAKECSSIRSGQALFISSVFAGHLFLRSNWRRACLSALTIPIAMCSNAVRIVVLSLLSIHVTPDFLYGDLHHRGGAVFALFGAALMGAILVAFRKWETSERYLMSRE